MKKLVKKVGRKIKQNYQYYKLGREGESIETRKNAGLENVKNLRKYDTNPEMVDRMEKEINTDYEKKMKNLMNKALRVSRNQK